MVANNIKPTAFLILAANAIVEHKYTWMRFLVEFIQQWQSETLDTAAEYKVLVERVLKEALVLTNNDMKVVLDANDLHRLLGAYLSAENMTTNRDMDISELGCDIITLITRIVYDSSKEKWLVPIIKDFDYSASGIHALPDRRDGTRPCTERYPE